ncbi:ferritin-like domain-containing protein [Chitinimonas koreensis]|uniref:ferritin-like domain-containing protein n=1 Tax=Chitinimonas koreensis TaxID=356302 RepID=UPI000403D228|nr:ferritin-like domain-containing protein [Chitinimonas koreensis]QNM94776.1 ferritin-like domain-containing protein [Chitinimonas koreensis]
MSTLAQVCRKLAVRRPGTPLGEDAAPVDLAQAWPAAFFRLDRSAWWPGADAAGRAALLSRCAAGLLVEALGIERTAMDYCAGRVLASADPLEKQVYAFTAADEARHYHWLATLAGDALCAAPPDAFTRFLQRLVAEGSPHAQSYLLQVILEGWGIHHYQRLAAHATDARLAAAMAGIAQDEALHYAAGVAHFDAGRLDAADRALVRAALAELCTMLACGPLAVLGALETAAGGFGAAERIEAFEALFDREATQAKLDQLARYVAHGGMEGEAAALAAGGLLRPLPAESCLALYG